MVQGTSHLDQIKALMTKKNLLSVIHWASTSTGVIGFLLTAFVVPGNEKLLGFGICGTLLAANQVLHKFLESLDKHETLAQALSVTLPLIQANAAALGIKIAVVEAIKEPIVPIPAPVVAAVLPLIQPVVENKTVEVVENMEAVEKKGGVIL